MEIVRELKREDKENKEKLFSVFREGIHELELISKQSKENVKEEIEEKLEEKEEVGYTDQDCISLLQDFQSAPENFDENDPKLYACLRPAPCAKGEREVKSHGRVYCTKRSHKQAVNNLDNTLVAFRKRVDLKRIEKYTEKDFDNNKLKMLRIKFELESSEVSDIKNEIDKEDKVLKELLDSAPPPPLIKYIHERQQLDRKEGEMKMTENLIELSKDNELLKGMMAQLIQHQTAMTQDISEMKVQLNKTHEAALYTLGEESYLTTVGRLFKGGLRASITTILTSPLFVTKLIFVRPWKKAFDKWLKDPIELIWGTLLLVASILALMVLCVRLNQSYPELMSILMSALNGLMSYIGKINSSFCAWLGPEVTEILATGVEYIKNGVINIWLWGLGALNSLFQSSIQFLINGITSKMKFWFGKKRVMKKRKSAKKSLRKTGKKSAKKSVRKTGKKSARKVKKSAKKSLRKTGKKSAKKSVRKVKKSAKKSVRKVRKSVRK